MAEVYFWVNPTGGSLYDFVREYYAEAREHLLQTKDVLYPLLFDFTEQERKLAHLIKPPLPPPELMPYAMSNQTLDKLFKITAQTSPRNPVELEDTYRNLEAGELIDFLNDAFPALKMVSIASPRAYTLLNDGYILKSGENVGYWTAAECKKILPHLRAICQPDHPDYLNYEEKINTYFYANCKTNPKLEDIFSVRQSLNGIREIAQNLVNNLGLLKKHEGLLADINY